MLEFRVRWTHGGFISVGGEVLRSLGLLWFPNSFFSRICVPVFESSVTGPGPQENVTRGLYKVSFPRLLLPAKMHKVSFSAGRELYSSNAFR